MVVLDEGGDTFEPGGPPHGICFAPEADTLEVDPTWVRLDDPAGYRASVAYNINRGRQGELDKTGTGTAGIDFLDNAGLLDPTNLDSPFNGNLDPLKQVAVALHNPVTGDWSTLFRGFKSEPEHEPESWVQDGDGVRGLDTLTWAAFDAFGLFAGLELTRGRHGDTPTFASFSDIYYHGIPSNLAGEPDAFQHVDDRIVQLLDDANWPGIGTPDMGLRDIFSGNVSMQGSVYARRDSLLSALFDAADAEFPGVSVIYASKENVVRFRGRFARFRPETVGYGIGHWYAGGRYQAGLDPDVAPISGLRYRRSENDIINAALALPQGVDDTDVPGSLVVDEVSIGKYGWRVQQFPDLLTSAGHDDDGPTTAVVETKRFATFYVTNFAYPRTRVTSVRFQSRSADSANAAALWDLLCNVELGDLLSLNTTFPGGGGFDEDFFVEGIHYTVTPMRGDLLNVALELDVSPRSFFDDGSMFGEIDLGLS